MYNLSVQYYPITAKPDAAGDIQPCNALRPYIRCFWGTLSSSEPSTRELAKEFCDAAVPPMEKETVIPDTCMDIIWEWDDYSGEADGVFCGINDTPFDVTSEPGSCKSMFAIRFHFWAVHLFADDHLRDVLNIYTEVEHYFSTFRKELGDQLKGTRRMRERIALAEAYLLRRLEGTRPSSDSMLNAVYTIVNSKGVVTADALKRSSGLSSRQLERLFREYIGISPKKTADLVRFQNVWRDLCLPSPHRNIQDVVFAYGYSHQSHLINNFKKFAGRTPLEALLYAGR